MSIDHAKCLSKLDKRRDAKFKKRRQWSEREKKTVLSVLKEFGFHDIKKFVEVLSCKTESQIIYFLKKYRKSALVKYGRKNDYFVQHTLDTIHPWLSFTNIHCDVHPAVHKQLISFVIPFIERYGKHPKPEEVGGIDFRLAYKALFKSLTEQTFSCDTNYETFSMIYACMNQLLNDIRMKQDYVETKLSSCVDRCITGSTRKKVGRILKEKTFQLPETNVLNFTPKELEELCEKI